MRRMRSGHIRRFLDVNRIVFIEDAIGGMVGLATGTLGMSSGSVLPSLDIVHDDTITREMRVQ